MGARGLDWRWGDALPGAVYAVPPVLVILFGDVEKGLAFAVGTVPAVLVGVRPARRGRVLTAVVGLVAALSILLGSLLSHVPPLAVAAMLLLPIGAARAAVRRPAGTLALVLCVPLVAVGLSYRDLGQGAAIAGLIACGSVASWLLSLLWPSRPGPPRRAFAALEPAAARSFGLRMGLAAAIAALVGYLAGLEHVGWATAAATFVTRPAPGPQRLRSYGRVLSVLAGGIAALLFVRFASDPWVMAAATFAVLTAASATRGGRWYITAAYTTFFVILLLGFADHPSAVAHFNERLVETAFGIALALVFSRSFGEGAVQRSR
ncbi:FUSC family protein [Actinomadura parmotrematis]|uniref:FUSC family protein n=1 Tax=Actinomadura parmotrematis TaxID=2864039 RepID=A0ABS7FXA5_9ACTN|nr:FUSC family protein [Actinomadura parmotrematis]MBW8484605.1 FUSC family protein [Actinomadura parmotrematis]